jgi:hypothetical protein
MKTAAMNTLEQSGAVAIEPVASDESTTQLLALLETSRCWSSESSARHGGLDYVTAARGGDEDMCGSAPEQGRSLDRIGRHKNWRNGPVFRASSAQRRPCVCARARVSEDQR